MKNPSILSLLLCAFTFHLNAFADDSAAARRLTDLGGKPVEQNGLITQLSFTDCSKLGEAEIRLIGQLAGLKTLTLYGKCVALSDSTAPLLTGLKELETLGVEGTKLSDAGLKPLASLPKLKSLSFFHLSFKMEGFTGAGFAAFTACPTLERLTVAGMSMGDEGFTAIGKLQQLKELATWHTFQTEAGNREIAKLPNLRKLHLGQRLPQPAAKAPSLSDDSIDTLAQMKSLEALKLGEAHFTHQALAKLKALPRLALLTLYETDLPEPDVESLRKELPGVKVDFQPLTAGQKKKLEMYLKQ